MRALYEAGPTGLSLVLNRKECLLRRLVWFCFTLFGIIYTGWTITSSYLQYAKHQASMNTVYRTNDQQIATFPRVTVCLNSAHSRERLDRVHPLLFYVAKHIYARGSTMTNNSLFNFHAGHQNFRKLLNSTAFQDKLMRSTYPNLDFVNCVYRNEDCAHSWYPVWTRLGRCYQFNSIDFDIAFAGQRNVEPSILLLTLAYNDSDFTYGFQHSSSDVSVFLDLTEEPQIISEKSRVHIERPDATTVVDVIQQHRVFLGPPYSECIDNIGEMHGYSREGCRQQVVAEVVINRCGCKLSWWPEAFAANRELRKCVILDWTECINDVTQYVTGHSCPIECNSFQYETRISYDGNHDHTVEVVRLFNQQQQGHSELKKVTTMIRLDSDTEFEMIETPDIPGPQLIADIGGMAGFMLGMSVATIIAVFDSFLSAVVKTVKCLYTRIFDRRINPVTVANKNVGTY